MLFIAYAFKGQVHVFTERVGNYKSLILLDKCNIEIFLSPAKEVYVISDCVISG